MEECILIDKDALNDIIIPTTNVDRLLPNGDRDPNEVVNKSQVYITTAGYKNSFAYDKLRELLVQSVLEPDKAFVMGGTWKIPVKEGLLSKDFIYDLKTSGTYDESSFDREYCSVWSGDSENAYYSSEVFDRCRKLQQPEYAFSNRSNKSAYYVIGVDVGRKGCTTEAVILKVTPQGNNTSLKSVVNICSFEEEHFENQAIALKKLFYLYKARVLVIDGNGIGLGLIDYMVKSQIDPETNDELPPFGIENDEDGIYKKFRTDNCERDAVYVMKANAPINTEAHSYVQTQMSSGKVAFLISERDAKAKFNTTKLFQELAPSQRIERLRPFIATDILKEEMMNLAEDNEGMNIILKRVSRAIQKDKFSAFEYAMYYVRKDEERKKKRKSSNRKLFFFNTN